MEIQGVKIGDMFINSNHTKSKIVSTVVDFIEHRSMVSGEVVKYEVVSEYPYMGQTMRGRDVITSVLIGKERLSEYLSKQK